MKKSFYIFGFILFCFSFIGKAQDIQFSQFYASALYLNPAFAGSDHHNRIMFHQRLQWPKLDAKYNTSMFAYDRYFKKYQSGFGIMMIQDYQGLNDLRTTDVSLQYAYELHLDNSHSLRFGLQTGLLARSVGYDLIFPHNLSTRGVVSPPDLRPVSRPMLDVSSGLLYYSKNFYTSVSLHHINEPSTDFALVPMNGGVPFPGPEVIGGDLPMKLAIVGGYKISMTKNSYGNTMNYLKQYIKNPPKRSITPTFHYKTQGKSDQLDLGMYAIYDVVLAGIWYRGIPVKRYAPGLHNNESCVAMVGWAWKGVEIGYSYDFIVSRLRPTNTFGAHEINITFVPHHFEKQKKIMKELPCPIPSLGPGR